MVRDRIVDQFSYRGDAGAIWRGFDAVLDTDAYLNLGYSSGRQTHAIGSPQRRLVGLVADQLARCGVGTGDRLLDVGCGRGGPAVVLTERLDVDYHGVDLVAHNLGLARGQSTIHDRRVAFILGDATALPVQTGTMDAASAIDTFVYLEELADGFDELHRSLESDGVAVVTDLLVDDAVDPERAVLRTFADRWGFPTLRRTGRYRTLLDDAGFDLVARADLTDHSVGRFRSWTTRYRRLRRLPIDGLLDRMAARLELDLAAIDRQVDAAHTALPHLEHVLFVLRRT